jgi:hypothetical protein
MAKSAARARREGDVVQSKLWIRLAAFFVLVMPACGARESAGVPGAAGGGSPGATDPRGGVSAASTPAGLRAAYIATAQREAPPAYVAGPSGRGAWRVHNEAHRFAADIDARGISVAPEAGTWHLGLSVARYGCSQRLQPVSRVEPEGEGNRIAYRRLDPGSGAPIEEWYVNGPLGLEQGFSIDAPPCAGEGTIAIEMALDGLAASPRGEGAAELRDGEGAAALRYTDVYARDAEGRALPARLSAEGKRLSIQVDAEGAAYPVEIDPLIWTQQAKLTASDGATNDALGTSVAVSGDGNTAVAGAPVFGFSKQGSAYVFVRSYGTWTQQAKLTALDGAAADNFGVSVAISGDGSTAIIGAGGANVDGKPFQGAAYVFKRNHATWTQQAKLTASDGVELDRFGDSVAVSGDASTVVVGVTNAAVDVDGNVARGAAYVFVHSGATWAQGAKLTGSDRAGLDQFGASVAVSGDGSTAVIGAGAADIGGNPLQGAAYVFVRSCAIWAQEAKLTASDGATFDQFGLSVAISGDGSTAVIGAAGADVDGNPSQGAAYVFVRSYATWPQQAKLTVSDGSGLPGLGSSVAVSGNGSTIVVGAAGADVDGNPSQGAAYVFARSYGTWTQQAKLTASDGTVGSLFGETAAVSADGKTAVFGAVGAHFTGTVNQGAAYVFVRAKSYGGPCWAAAP